MASTGAKYSACVHVDDYDDDFMLVQGPVRTPIHEGRSSLPAHGNTPAEALKNLISELAVTDYNMVHSPDTVPAGYSHVAWVRTCLQELLDKARRGVVDEDDMRWGGNWDVTFMIQAEEAENLEVTDERCSALVHELVKGGADLETEAQLAAAIAANSLRKAATEIRRLYRLVQELEAWKAKVTRQVKFALRRTPNHDAPDDPYGTKAFLQFFNKPQR